jgi:DNA-binding NarL/FixJ family response regulator
VALSDGAKGYVLKPDAGRELLSGLEIVLAGGRFLSRGVKEFDFTDTSDADCPKP